MELKKGMKVYCIGGMSKSYRCVGKIERLTTKQAVLENGQRFWTHKITRDGEIQRVGDATNGGYLRDLFYVETPEIMKLVREQELREAKVVARTKLIARIGEELRSLEVYEAINRTLDGYDKQGFTGDY